MFILKVTMSIAIIFSLKLKLSIESIIKIYI